MFDLNKFCLNKVAMKEVSWFS